MVKLLTTTKGEDMCLLITLLIWYCRPFGSYTPEEGPSEKAWPLAECRQSSKQTGETSNTWLLLGSPHHLLGQGSASSTRWTSCNVWPVHSGHNLRFRWRKWEKAQHLNIWTVFWANTENRNTSHISAHIIKTQAIKGLQNLQPPYITNRRVPINFFLIMHSTKDY